MGVLLQALEIILEVQWTSSNEKIARRKISFSTHKMCFFFLFSSLWTLLLSKLLTFSFLVHFNDLKCYTSTTFSLKSSLNFNSKKTTYKKFFGWSGLGFVMFGGFFSWILDPLYFGGHIFLSFHPFLKTFTTPDVPTKGVQVLFTHQKQSPLLGSDLP